MTVAHPPTRITPEEFLRLPDSSNAELVDGQIVEKQVSVSSIRCEAAIIKRFTLFLNDYPVAELFTSDMGYRCFPDDPSRIRKPDVSIIRNERLAELADSDPGFMPIVPDLAVEVISPNDRFSEINQKILEYLEAEFPLIWVVDPQLRRVMVFAPDGEQQVLTAAKTISAPSALPGFSCLVADLLPAPLPAPATPLRP